MTWEQRFVWPRIHWPIHETGMDRNNWGDGPWTSEPDAIYWTDDETEMPCLIWRGHLGQLNGYVGVDGDHPYFGLDYDQIDMIDCTGAHGGLTFAGSARRDLPFRVHPKHRVQKKWNKRWSVSALGLWWFGFDCAHGGDYTPGLMSINRLVESKMPEHLRDLRKHLPLEIYRDVAYVRNEVAQLAAHLAPSPGVVRRRKRGTVKEARAIEHIRWLEFNERRNTTRAEMSIDR